MTTIDRETLRRRRDLDREWSNAGTLALTNPRGVEALAEVLDRFGEPGPFRLDVATARLIAQLASVALAEICLRGLEGRARGRDRDFAEAVAGFTLPDHRTPESSADGPAIAIAIAIAATEEAPLARDPGGPGPADEAPAVALRRGRAARGRARIGKLAGDPPAGS